ncbi:cellulase family glycosylhydrolase [Mycolicibacterium sp.]|uniref:cellulase family glycosylhydrolase n=1 Tax=Mycolicibacterium sp. TaxID=2320850 RepID=UPI001A27FBF0|nr:cellulase family glycosylhydrolase [Mycolicibacterium sp.]MBJ7340557.1 cellulase family glycosylhydrolase [Mycolicibacterium sp.]
MATVAISAVGATTMVPTMNTVTMNVLPVAAIDQSSDTIGFADSDLYGMTPAQIDAQLDQMQAMGVNDVRVIIPWAGVEFYPSYYNWAPVDYMVNAADSRGMGVLGVINSTPTWATQPGQPALSGAPASPQAYGDFAGLVAQRYAGKVGAYEIWNEPNAAMFYAPQPDPAGYTDLLKAAYPEIKAADPNATVIGGVTGAGITYGNLTMNPIDFVNGIYAAGGEPYFDALSFHPYQYTTQFSQGGYLPDSPINQLAAMHDVMVANGDGGKLIWASEYGEPSSVAGEANQAAYLQDMLTTWRTLGYTGPSFVWTLQDRDSTSTNTEDTFGVIRSDGTWKPAAYVIQQLATQPSTTPAMARMALAMPEAQTAAPADLAALTTLAQTPAAPGPTTPVAAAVQVAADSLAAAGQFATTALNQVNAMLTAAMPAVPAPAPEAPKTPATETPAKETPAPTDSTPAKDVKPPKDATTRKDVKPPKDATSRRDVKPPKDATSRRDEGASKDAADAGSKRSVDSPKRPADKRERPADDRQKPRHAERG